MPLPRPTDPLARHPPGLPRATSIEIDLGASGTGRCVAKGTLDMDGRRRWALAWTPADHVTGDRRSIQVIPGLTFKQIAGLVHAITAYGADD